jgi:uncharacterized protein (DUF1778 family)
MSPSARSRRTARIEARLHEDVKVMIERAAAMEGISVSDFIVRSAQTAAERALEEQSVIRLSEADSRVFINAIDNPPEPGPRLRNALDEYRKQVRR